MSRARSKPTSTGTNIIDIILSLVYDAAMDKGDIKFKAQVLLTTQGKLAAAQYLAETLFADEVDKAGAPYIGHLRRVADGVTDPAIKPAAWLHDLIEDIPGWTYDDLRDIGFGTFDIDAVRAVTKTSENEPYFDAIVRVGLTPQAISVKRSDLRDNSNLLRLNRKPLTKDFERVTKYWLAYNYLGDIERGTIKPGTAFEAWMTSKPDNMQDRALLAKEIAPRKSNPGSK